MQEPLSPGSSDGSMFSNDESVCMYNIYGVEGADMALVPTGS
jgi:hypothetical protein